MCKFLTCRFILYDAISYQFHVHRIWPEDSCPCTYTILKNDMVQGSPWAQAKLSSEDSSIIPSLPSSTGLTNRANAHLVQLQHERDSVPQQGECSRIYQPVQRQKEATLRTISLLLSLLMKTPLFHQPWSIIS